MAGRGSHPASRANLAAAPGGDRYAGKRMVIEAIEEALRTVENGNEVREFFGLGPLRVLKQKHRDRWAEIKAPVVYRTMVEAMSMAAACEDTFIMPALSATRRAEIYASVTQAEIGMYGSRKVAALAKENAERLELGRSVGNFDGLQIGGFVDIRATESKTLYPVAAGKGAALAESQLDYVRVELLGFADYFGELPAAVRWANLGSGVVFVDYVSNGAARPVVRWLSRVKVSAKMRVRLTFEGSGQVEEREVDCYGRHVWAWLILPDNNYWIPWEQLPEFVAIERYIQDEADWMATAAAVYLDGAYVPSINDMDGAMTIEQWEAARAAEPSGWEFEYPVLGEGKGGSVPRIASFFPRRQRVYGVIDPVNAVVAYGDLEWVDWEVWEAHFGATRGQWLAAGCIVPPQVCPPVRRSLGVTFDPEFIAAIQPD